MPVSISGDGAIDGLAFNSFGDVNITSPAAGDKLVYDGTEWKNLVGYQYAGTRYYTSDGTFAKANPLGTGDIGLRAIRVRMVGGGGGSGGASATGVNQQSHPAAGGGGGYAEAFLLVSALSTSENVTRGAGGTAGAAGNNSGGAGGQSSFGSLVVAGGGSGGSGRSVFGSGAGAPGSNGAPGGIGTAGDLLIRGSGSGNNFDLGSNIVKSIAGGASYLSGQQNETHNIGSRNSEVGLLYGGGAMAGANAASQPAAGGAAGGNGIVIVECYV
jgi:hypothetical protein